MKIGILGGSFDPVHEGHLSVARSARDQFFLDQVIFIPSFISPNKKNQKVSLGDHRLKMLELAIQGEAGFVASELELVRGGISYTIDTLETLRLQYPQDSFFLILGEDSYQTFSSWKNSDQIKKQVTLLVAPRSTNRVYPNESNVSWISMDRLPYASSDLRLKLKSQSAVRIPGLKESVQKYIRDEKLYQDIL